MFTHYSTYLCVIHVDIIYYINIEKTCVATAHLYVNITKHTEIVKANPHWVNTEMHVRHYWLSVHPIWPMQPPQYKTIISVINDGPYRMYYINLLILSISSLFLYTKQCLNALSGILWNIQSGFNILDTWAIKPCTVLSKSLTPLPRTILI